MLDDYAATLEGADSTLANKLSVIAKLKETWFGIDSLPLRTVKPSQVQHMAHETLWRLERGILQSWR